jgi:tetratricopeptide (TPR) repeat protein
MNATDLPAAPAMQESGVARVLALMRQRNFSSMLAAAEALLEGAPGDRDALLLVAMAQRFLARIEDALKTLEVLESHHPGFSRLYQERGHCHVALRQAPPAIEAFLLAVNLNAALPASWRMLESLYRMTGQANEAATAAGHVAALGRVAPAVVNATGLFADGDLDAAERMVRAHLLIHGDDIEGMRLLARIGIARDVLDDAELLLAAVLDSAPDYRVARHEYAGVLLERHRHQAARAQLEQLLALDPGHRAYRNLYAACCAGLGEHERAIVLFQELLTGTAADADLHLAIAHAQKTLGRRQDAIESYHRAAACRPGFGDAWWSLANLKTYQFTEDELSALRAAEAAPGTAAVDRVHLCFALGKALEDRGDYADSFRHYERGNALKRAESKYRGEIFETNTRQQIEVCTAGFFAERRDFGVPDPDPIFIVGLPRSGSTLLEQILASHSAVEGTQELAEVQRFVLELQGRDPDLDDPRYPRILPRMAAADFRALGERYLAETRVYRGVRPFFIDKMPNNFRHIGLIRLMLPNARIIDARREPMACCFSNFKQLFARGQEFTYGIEDIARYYRTYIELMRHWDAVLPGWILRVQHEDVVRDLEGSVRRILDFCGLEFEPRCVEFHKTHRSVRTASSEQVRQPIFREGLDQWKHFEPWLAPLETALGDALTRYREP